MTDARAAIESIIEMDEHGIPDSDDPAVVRAEIEKRTGVSWCRDEWNNLVTTNYEYKVCQTVGRPRYYRVWQRVGEKWLFHRGHSFDTEYMAQRYCEEETQRARGKRK